MDEKQTSGSAIIDTLLRGGFEKGIITTLYGPSGIGKTNICLASISSVFAQKKKIIYIDTENSFSLDRFMQLNPSRYKEILDYVVILRAHNYQEMKNIFLKLPDIIQEDIGIVIVDGIATHYRVELSQGDRKTCNADLSMWMSLLSEIAYRYNIPVVLTSQVYSDFSEKDRVNIVGGDLIKYSSKCLIELYRHNNARMALLVKHRSIAEGVQKEFEIWDEGLIAPGEIVKKEKSE